MSQSALTTADVYPVDGTIYIDFTQVDDTPKYDQTNQQVDTNKGPAIYCLVGTGGVSAGGYAAITQSTTTGVFTATKEDTTSSGSNPRKGAVAIAAAAAASYAWFLTGPFERVPVDVANGISSGAALTTTATAGQLGAGGDTVVSLYCLEASATSVLTSCSAVTAIGSNF